MCGESYCPPRRWLPSFLGNTARRPFFFMDRESMRVVQPLNLVFSPHDGGYIACCAPDSGARSMSASIIFICAFSDNVPEIVRTLYNGLIATNNKVRGFGESPPLYALWLSLPETGGAAARLLPGDCTTVASLLLQLPLHSLRAVADRPYHLCRQPQDRHRLITEVLSGALVLPCAVSVPQC